MAANRKILILPGDGIGPEVMRQVERVIDWFGKRRAPRFELERGPGRRRRLRRARHAAHRRDPGPGAWRPTPCCSARSAARNGTACRSRRSPSAASCACARTWSCSPTCARRWSSTPLADASTLKPELVAGLDIMIVRELTGGIYFGEPRGIETLPDGTAPRRRHPGLHHARDRARRPRRLRAGAQARQQACCSVEKANVMEIGRALARGGAEAARRRISRTSSSTTCTPTTAPCSSSASPSSSTSSSPTTCSATSCPTARRC